MIHKSPYYNIHGGCNQRNEQAHLECFDKTNQPAILFIPEIFNGYIDQRKSN